MNEQRIILVSNRLPVTVKVERGQVKVGQSAGGLATGLRGPHERSGGTWIGWPGDVSRLSDEQRHKLDAHLEKLRCVPVHLTSAEVSRYYDGFSNSVLWPLFHYLLDRIPPHSEEWDVYRSVNERFADVAAKAWRPGDLVWVHDYQLMLVPRMLRERVPTASIGFFLHIPFPASEVLRILPWREQVLEGLLGADLVGFHTFAYRGHFLSSVLQILGIPAESDRLYFNGREVRTGVFPIGVDAESFGALAESTRVLKEADRVRRDAGGERILLGIDRLDYTKGIVRRLLAFERLLEREPRWRRKVRLVQIAVPSRDKVPSYEEFQREVNELVGRINGAYSTVDWVPIHYVHRSLSQEQVVALYRAADVMLVTPLRDGLNLVAKEFVTCRPDESGVLVLSEFAGAAAEMGEALQINPYDIERMTRAYSDALTMPEEERRIRMRALRQRIASRDANQWAQGFIDALAGIRVEVRDGTRLSTAEELSSLAARLGSAERLVLFLDYDGTIVPFARAPGLAAPDRSLRSLLAGLAARPGVSVHMVSGRPRDSLERWLGDLPVGLHAEHGYWSRTRPNGPWQALENVDTGWKPRVRRLFDELAAATPGTLIEEKTASLAWHWRMADPELGNARAIEIAKQMETGNGGPEVEVLRGDKVVEIRARGVSKARAAEQVLSRWEGPPPTIAAMGDDETDEDLFRALPADAAAVAVGFRAHFAHYRVATPAAARALLAGILGGR